MEGFIADSTFNIISATLDEKSFDTKTLTPRYHLPPPPSTDTDKKNPWELRDMKQMMELILQKMTALRLEQHRYIIYLGYSEGLGLFTLYFYNIALWETSERNAGAK